MAYNYNDNFYNANKASQLQFSEMNNTTQYYDQNTTYQVPNQNYNQAWGQQQYFYPSQNDTFKPQSGDFMQNNEFQGTDFDNEPPLLEELGINFDHIFRKTKCVLNPLAQPHESIIHDEDLAGPLVFCIAYGFSLLLMGKIHFGYIYGITALGCVSMYALLNLMSEKGVNAMCIGSTLGYCLLPMVFLSFLSSFFTMKSYAGLMISIFFILWCSLSSSKLFVNALNMSNQQLLVLYPCFLLYGIFALLNVF
ncbi:unnamed protein product [Brachionus calyciflorus]|uniref:Protein YIPF n=1 Tax=Brachionus calyciflorus TaxID=104777 RepID=A0A813W8C5_9BILA|nr:unnamed protein product [Brachionus calyciflorus]